MLSDAAKAEKKILARMQLRVDELRGMVLRPALYLGSEEAAEIDKHLAAITRLLDQAEARLRGEWVE